MPVGLDGNPDPISTPERAAVLAQIAAAIDQLPGDRIAVGVDGRSGAGKSTFADELKVALEELDHTVVRSTTDSFHQPASRRLRQGPTSAEGYVADSHQLDRILDDLLAPFAAGANRVLVSAWDEPSDGPDERHVDLPGAAVLVFDGLFVHRDELVGFWDYSILLEADERLDRRWLEFLLGDLPDAPTASAAIIDERLGRARWPRYREGWRRYADQTQPATRADAVVTNDDLTKPRLR